jgi:hypothetical protein
VFASASAEAEKGTSPISYGNGKRSPSITAHRALFFSRCFVPDHCGRLLFFRLFSFFSAFLLGRVFIAAEGRVAAVWP